MIISIIIIKVMNIFTTLQCFLRPLFKASFLLFFVLIQTFIDIFFFQLEELPFTFQQTLLHFL